jgi:hypothetical protein
MDSQIFREWFQGSKPNGLKCSLYHWETFGTQMSEMGLHDPLGHLKNKLWPKERPKVKLPIWLPTTQSCESPQFARLQITFHIMLKSFQQGLQLCFRPHLNHRFAHKVMGPQSYESPSCENDSHLGVSRQNAIWMLVMWLTTKYTIRGKVVASPKSGPWWILWVRICPWLVLAPKVLQLCTNQLVVWFVQIHVSD